MLKLSEISLPLERVAEKAPAEELKRGILSEEERKLLIQEISQILRIREEHIHSVEVVRRSVDARKKQYVQHIIFKYTVLLSCENERKIAKQYKNRNVRFVEQKASRQRDFSFARENPGNLRPVVVGMGPAGLFAALTLAEAGRNPIVLERGSAVEIRKQKVSAFWAGGALDPECNVQFGEGGAGTFSDGKLNTLVKDPEGIGRQVLETFVNYGAPEEILYLQKPHIGTDRLEEVVRRMRQEIISLGGEVRFDTKFRELLLQGEQVRGLLCEHQGKIEEIATNTLILATGHSARDTFYQLKQQGIPMEAKAFAVGVRMEHPQEMINKNQFGLWHDKLWPADYKLKASVPHPMNARGVYSFCMCPGGKVVNASSEPGKLVVNGMSNYARDGRNANSAIIVTVRPMDYALGAGALEGMEYRGDLISGPEYQRKIEENALAGIEFQRQLETAAYEQGQGKIPVQSLWDYQHNRESTGLGNIIPDMCGDYRLANVREIFPKFIGDAIAECIHAFDRKIPGYGRSDAIVSGVESRTSSPVRILRDETMQSTFRGMYPCGEGAGYAGGITSAAMDGIRVAEQVLSSGRD